MSRKTSNERTSIEMMTGNDKIQFLGNGSNPFIFHSLSWSRKSDILPNGRIYAKVWFPEDPRTSKTGATYE